MKFILSAVSVVIFSQIAFSQDYSQAEKQRQIDITVHKLILKERVYLKASQDYEILTKAAQRDLNFEKNVRALTVITTAATTLPVAVLAGGGALAALSTEFAAGVHLWYVGAAGAAGTEVAGAYLLAQSEPQAKLQTADLKLSLSNQNFDELIASANRVSWYLVNDHDEVTQKLLPILNRGLRDKNTLIGILNIRNIFARQNVETMQAAYVYYQYLAQWNLAVAKDFALKRAALTLIRANL